MYAHRDSSITDIRTVQMAVAVKTRPAPAILGQSVTKATSKLLRVLAVGSILAIGWAAGVQATTITVNTTNDELNANGNCSLREAIVAVNTQLAVDSCPPGSGSDDTVFVPTGLYSLTITGQDENAALTGDLDITRSVTIQGAGGAGWPEDRQTIIDAEGIDRVFHILVSSTDLVRINQLVVRGGHITTDTPRGCWAGGMNFPVGGGIAHFSTGTTWLSGLVIANNVADLGNGGIDAAGPCYDQQGALDVYQCIIEGNTGSGLGVGAGINTTVSTLKCNGRA